MAKPTAAAAAAIMTRESTRLLEASAEEARRLQWATVELLIVTRTLIQAAGKKR